MAEVKVTLIGFTELQRKFNKFAKRLKNKEPMFKAIGIKLLNEINRTFETETFEGEPWQRLSEATKKSRRRGRGPEEDKILQDTGNLKNSYSPQNPESRYFVSRSFVRVGTNVEYAASHEFGIGNPEREMIPTKKRALQIAVPVADFFIKRSLQRTRLI